MGARKVAAMTGEELLARILPSWRAGLPPRLADKEGAFFAARRARIMAALGLPREVVEPPPDEKSKGQRELANLEAMRIVASKKPGEMTPAERRAILRYSGWGGLSIDKHRGQFPPGMEPETFGLIHEYYTPTVVCEAIAQRICPLIPGLAGHDGIIRGLEPSAGIGRMVRALSSPTCPAGDKISWITVEFSKVSSAIWQAMRPDVKNYQMSFERFVAEHGASIRRRANIVLSNPPYGERGEFAHDDPDKEYKKEKKAYAYFLRRGLEMLAPGGLGVYLVPAAFLSGESHKRLRALLLKRYHLSCAFRLPSNLPSSTGTAGREFIPGAQVVIDILFWRARGGELAEVDADDQFILDGNYYAEFPDHILGREIIPFEQSGGKRNPYEVVGTFNGLPPLIERPICTACSVGIIPTKQDEVPEPGAATTESPELASAISLGDRVGKYLALRAADDTTELVHLYPELHGALEDLIRSRLAQHGGNPWRWRELVEAAQRRHIQGAEHLLNAFSKTGQLAAALAQPPKEEPSYKGDPDDILGQANELFRQHRELTVDDLMQFHRSVGGKRSREDALRILLTAEWNLDGQQWNELLPKQAYLSGRNLWERHDIAKVRADAGDAQAITQVRRLLDAIKPAVYEDIIDVSPQHGYVPLDMVSEFVSETLNSAYGEVEFERDGGLIKIVDQKYGSAHDESYERAISSSTLEFLGWLNHDNKLFEPSQEVKNEQTGEKYTMAEQRVLTAKRWSEKFQVWVAAEDSRRRRLTEAYNRSTRGRVVPVYSSDPIDIARWGATSPKLRAHQVAGARRVLDNRGGMVAFDVGVGKTYTALAIIARARQEGWVRRPVVLVPSSIVWKWHDDIRCTLPDYRVEVIGSNRFRLSRGKRKGQLTSETDTPDQRAQKWVRFQAGEVDVVVLSYDAMDRTQMSEDAVQQYIAHVAAIDRNLALRKRNLEEKSKSKKGKEKLSERDRALLEHGSAAWIREILTLPENEKYDPGIRWNELGVDMLIVDEAQNFKNLYMPQPREGGVPKFMGASGSGSKRAWQLDFRAAAVRRRTGGAGVVLLSATPAKNSPLEFYSLIQYIDPTAFTKSGIYDPEQFIDRFLKIEMADVLNMAFDVTQRSAVTGFKNLDDLRTIILTYGEFRTAEEVKLKLPQPVVERVMITMNDAQEDKYDTIVSEIEERIEEKKGGTAVLGMLARLSLISIHADLDEGYTYDTALEGGLARKKVSEKALPFYQERRWRFAGHASSGKAAEGEDDDQDQVWVEKQLPKPDYDSPKFTECARRVAAAKHCGHIIFCEPTATHIWMREVLVKAGIPRERIAILNADATKPADRVRIAREFNGLSSEPLPAGTCANGGAVDVEPKYDVVIANSVAYEGIDLQVRTCSIHHLDIPWTPSDLQQRNGRGVRQGNKLATIGIYYYFADRSSDGYRFSLVDGKATWMKDLLASQVRDTNNPAAQQQLTPQDILLMISRNKEKTIKLLEDRKKAAEEEARKKIVEEASRLLRQASGRFREGRETKDPERSAVLRAEGETRLADLARIDPKVWPWATWMYIVRDTEVITNTAGAPAYEGLQIVRPKLGFPGEFEHYEFGKVLHEEDGVRIGIRGAGSARWQVMNLDTMELKPDMYPHEGVQPWPGNDDAKTRVAVEALVDQVFGSTNGAFMSLGWRAASDAFIDQWWPLVRKKIAAGLDRSYHTREPYPVVMPDGKMVLAPKGDISDGMLLPPSAAGWKQYLALASASGAKFGDLRDVGERWWKRKIPQDLLSRERPKPKAGEAETPPPAQEGMPRRASSGRAQEGMPRRDVNTRQRTAVDAGTEAELAEHGGWADRATARRIAEDHLREDPHFYDKKDDDNSKGWRH